jgi:prepilin-type N-terminal cleavage/methylation domain-containing protein
MPRPSSPPLPPGPAGFSLPELMIGLVVLVIALGVGAPQLLALQRRQQLRQAAAAVAAHLEAGRAAALASNRPCELSAGGSQLRPSPASCGEPPLAPLQLNPAIRLEGPATTLRFSATGMLTGSPAQQELLLAMAGVQPRHCVSVERPSALVRIGQAAAAGSPCRYGG